MTQEMDIMTIPTKPQFHNLYGSLKSDQVLTVN